MTEVPELLVVGGEETSAAAEAALDPREVNVHRAIDLPDAVKWVEDRTPDCVLYGVDPTGVRPETALDLLHDAAPSLPVLLFGGMEDPERVIDGLTAGAAGYVRDIEADLADRVREIVARSRVEAARADHRRARQVLHRLVARLGSSTDRSDAERAAYAALSSSELYDLVWIVRYDPDAGELNLREPVKEPVPASGLPVLPPEDEADPFAEAAGSDQVYVVELGSTFTRRTAAGSPPQNGPAPGNCTGITTILVPFGETAGEYGFAVLSGGRTGPVGESEREVLRTVGGLVGRWVRLETEREGAAGRAGDRARVEEVLSYLAHELRNPLSIAAVHLDLAREEGDPDAFQRTERALDRIDRVIDDVTTLVAGIDEVDTAAQDLAETARAAWTFLDPADAELEIPASRRVVADHDLLETALSNLFRNALTHAGEDVVVRVGLRDDGFSVADDGPGIQADMRDRVFEWGFSTGEGLGIGLTLVKEIADAHGWEIDVRESDDDGARFDVTGVEWADDEGDEPGTSGGDDRSAQE